MAYRRSNAFNADIDQALLQLIEGFQYDPYTVQATSGYRPGDKRQHGSHTALDLELIDPKTGQRLGNYQDPRTFGAYQQYANALYQHALKTNPELAAKLRWGGYFSGGPGKYGALDLMHFDVGGGAMGGGSWEGGLTPEQAKIWGLQAGGGIGQLDAQMQAAGYTPEQRRAAIASIESAGSGDYKALGQVTNRQGDRAYGKYQVMASNIPAWTKQALGREMTPEEFLANPEAQDKVFDTIYGDYVQKHGERGAASMWFTGSPNEPNVTDIGGKLTGKSYADKYMAALGAPPVASPYDSPSESTGGPGTGGGTLGTPVADKEKKPWWQRALGGLGEAGATNFGGGTQQPIVPLAPTPGAAVSQLQPMSPVNPQAEEMKRQMLAQAMARLNSGKLFG